MEILQAINQHNGLRAAEVARVVEIPRPTAYRLLETLEGMGLIVRGPSDERWRPTLQTKSLSSGFRDEDWVAQIAVPKMMKLGRQVLWPLDLVAFHDYRMAIRESTHNISPFSVDHGMVGRELPVLQTAGGRAYLSFLPAPERARVLEGLRARLGDAAVDFVEDGPLNYVLERCHELGLGFRIKGFNNRTMSISAPIMGDDRPIACLTMIWIASALKFDEAVTSHGSALVETADDIADELKRLASENMAS